MTAEARIEIHDLVIPCDLYGVLKLSAVSVGWAVE